ncbi:MAG: hypothetical protein IJK18_03715 [Clostridia bacterium]|nr:hypothetical protein [Clostridia bacterium]
MRPVLPENKMSFKLIIVYIVIFIICAVGIALALAKTEYFEEENVGRALGIIDKDSEKEDEYNELKNDFDTIFNNQIENFQQGNINIKKISNDYDVVVTAFNYKESRENCTIDVAIPYININHVSAKQFNKRVKEIYRKKAETLKNQISSMNIIYTVQYKAYLQNNILSLAIRLEYKEGEKSQKIMVDTFNYNVVEQREVTIDEILKIKDLKNTDATNKIRREIKSIQEQNQALIDSGYSLYQRDYNSAIYDALNCKYFLYGKNGMLYVIYPYGNQDDTSETDIVIFE